MNATAAKFLNARTTSDHSAEVRKAASTFDHLPDSGFIRQAQLIPHIVPFSSATLWRKCKAGHFPKPVKLSERVTAWKISSIREWLEAQANGASA